MKIEFRKQIDSDAAPWQPLTNIDELIWNGVFTLRVTDDNGSHGLPFHFANDDIVTIVVKDHSHEGILENGRTVVQTITRVDRTTGCISNYSRFCSIANGKPTWSKWTSDEKNVITWSKTSHIDKFTAAGIYNIAGERTNAGDGLPFANSNPGHTFHARLVVLDSSINDSEVCVTQVLMLSNRVGGDGNVYVRTGNATSKGELQSGEGWEPWGKLQQNIEVGQVISLDSFVDNGIYSGVYTVSPTQLETFVMVVINNYAVAEATGMVRYITQFKYAIDTNGVFSFLVRTGQGTDVVEWGGWIGAFPICEPCYNTLPIVPKIINSKNIVELTPDMKSWVNNDTSGHVSDNLVQVYDEVYQMNRKCVELTSTDRGRFYTPLSGSVDFTSNVLRGSLCIQKDYPTENLGVLEVELHSNNSINSSNRATFTIQYGNLNDSEYNSRYVRGGWFHFCVNPDALIIATKRGENFDITNVTHVGIHPYHTTGIPLKVYVGDFSVVKNLLKPGVVTIVDNFDTSVPAMADYAFSKGVKLNLSIVPNWIEKGSGCATLEEINRIKRQGHFIFSHTFDHIIDTRDMTELQIVEEIIKGAEWMQNNGFNRGKFVVSNPSAMFPLAKYEAYMESPLQMLYHHWTSCPADSSRGILLYYPYYPMSRLLNISSLDKCDDAILIARKAKEKGGIAVNGYHGTFWSADGGTQWKKYIDAIAELDVKHYGIDEIIEGSVV